MQKCGNLNTLTNTDNFKYLLFSLESQANHKYKISQNSITTMPSNKD